VHPVRKIRHQPPHDAQGPTIKTARESQGLTQEQLGDAIAKTQLYVSLLERNHRSAAGRPAKAIELALSIPTLTLPRMLPEQHALGRQAIPDVRKQAQSGTGSCLGTWQRNAFLFDFRRLHGYRRSEESSS
jgi:transcriptional regulator with XRE-family HTH domain